MNQAQSKQRAFLTHRTESSQKIKNKIVEAPG